MSEKTIHFTIEVKGKSGGPIEDVEENLRYNLDQQLGIEWQFISVTTSGVD